VVGIKNRSSIEKDRRSHETRSISAKQSPQKLGFLGEYNEHIDTDECSPQKSIKYSPIKASPQKYYSKLSSTVEQFIAKSP